MNSLDNNDEKPKVDPKDYLKMLADTNEAGNKLREKMQEQTNADPSVIGYIDASVYVQVKNLLLSALPNEILGGVPLRQMLGITLERAREIDKICRATITHIYVIEVIDPKVVRNPETGKKTHKNGLKTILVDVDPKNSGELIYTYMAYGQAMQTFQHIVSLDKHWFNSVMGLAKLLDDRSKSQNKKERESVEANIEEIRLQLTTRFQL